MSANRQTQQTIVKANLLTGVTVEQSAGFVLVGMITARILAELAGFWAHWPGAGVFITIYPFQNVINRRAKVRNFGRRGVMGSNYREKAPASLAAAHYTPP